MKVAVFLKSDISQGKVSAIMALAAEQRAQAGFVEDGDAELSQSPQWQSGIVYSLSKWFNIFEIHNCYSKGSCLLDF